MKNSKAFTLIEILIVLALVGGMAVLVLPRLSTVDRIKSSIRKLSVTIKQAHHQAQLSNTVHRLVIDLSNDNEDSKKQEQSFYLEVSQNKSANLILGEDSRPTIEEKEDSENKEPPGFIPDTKILKRKETLANAFFFDDVEYKDKSFTSGKAYIYFFPQGFITQAAIHISNREKIHYTLLIHPLTGQVTIFNENKKLQELQQ